MPTRLVRVGKLVCSRGLLGTCAWHLTTATSPRYGVRTGAATHVGEAAASFQLAETRVPGGFVRNGSVDYRTLGGLKVSSRPLPWQTSQAHVRWTRSAARYAPFSSLLARQTETSRLFGCWLEHAFVAELSVVGFLRSLAPPSGARHGGSKTCPARVRHTHMP